MIDARARLLYEPTFSSLEDLHGFLADAEAPIARLAAGAGVGAASDAYALARFAPVLAPVLAADAAGAALRRYREGSSALRALSPARSGSVAFLALAPGYAARPGGGRWPLAKRATLFRAILTGRF